MFLLPFALITRRYFFSLQLKDIPTRGKGLRKLNQDKVTDKHLR